MSSVYHVNDPRLKGNRELAMTYGGWDYHSWFRPPEDDPSNLPEEVVQKIVDLASENPSIKTVAKKVRSAGVTESQVAAVFLAYEIEEKETADT